MQMSETDFTLSACQNLSLIVTGHHLHKANAFPKDMFCLVCVRERNRDGRRVICPRNQIHFSHITAVIISQIAYMMLNWWFYRMEQIFFKCFTVTFKVLL